MLISHSHKFIKIDIPKVGTKTFIKTLLPLGVVDVLGEPDRGNFYQHASIVDCEAGFKNNGWNFDDYFKFSVVRNPWQRYVSFLRWMESFKNDRDFSAFEKNGKLDLGLIITKNNPQDFYLLKNGDLLVDAVGQLESIYKDFAVFCEEVGVLPIPDLKHSNKNSYEKPYTEYYTQELIEMVAEKEKWVIDRFGYNFAE